MDVVPIIYSNTTLTTYKFYTEFLENTSNKYKEGVKDIIFQLFEKGDSDPYSNTYRIEPIVLPLLLSLFEQLSKFHKTEIPIQLHNNPATIDVLEFLYKCDFFHIGGNNKNPTFPTGRKLFTVNDNFLGGFKMKKLRNEHRVRAYSLSDDNLNSHLQNLKTDEEQRDFLVSHYTYKVREQFKELLFDNIYTAALHNTYIDILSELITNAVLHSKSNAFALMFVDRFKTKFSISDNGLGLEKSMEFKQSNGYYKLNSLKNLLDKEDTPTKISKGIRNNLHVIFETLYYSSLKDRHGLFDLMINAVLNCQGYFRLHFENSQIMISNRMMDELFELAEIRNAVYDLHTAYSLDQIKKEEWEQQLQDRSSQMRSSFVSFYNRTVKKYSEDIMYSSLRFYKVKFKGVHIEVEIPNTFDNANI